MGLSQWVLSRGADGLCLWCCSLRRNCLQPVRRHRHVCSAEVGKPADTWLRSLARLGLSAHACVGASRHGSRRCSPRALVSPTRFGGRMTRLFHVKHQSVRPSPPARLFGA